MCEFSIYRVPEFGGARLSNDSGARLATAVMKYT